jgi:hypothetical protein
VEKQRVARAKTAVSNEARAPFLSGFARLLRCRKDFGQFAGVVGVCSKKENVICTALAA